MLRMVSYSRRLQSGQITCYLTRTYHVLTTRPTRYVASWVVFAYLISAIAFCLDDQYQEHLSTRAFVAALHR